MRWPAAVERWLDEGWSPWRIGTGVVSGVALAVTVYGYVSHPHHPGAVWWLLAAVAAVAVWALLEMARWRIRHNRIHRRLAEAESRLNAPLVTEPGPSPLVPRYGQSLPYRHAIGNMTEHRIGIRNPAGNPEATGVRLEWTGMSPDPDVVNERWQPAIPCAVPRTTGGDPAVGIPLLAGQEELWVPVTTATSPDGVMNAVEFGPSYGSSRGNWHGLVWILEPGGRWRLRYRIVADNLPAVTFSVVITADGGHIQCDLEG